MCNYIMCFVTQPSIVFWMYIDLEHRIIHISCRGTYQNQCYEMSFHDKFTIAFLYQRQFPVPLIIHPAAWKLNGYRMDTSLGYFRDGRGLSSSSEMSAWAFTDGDNHKSILSISLYGDGGLRGQDGRMNPWEMSDVPLDLLPLSQQATGESWDV